MVLVSLRFDLRSICGNAGEVIVLLRLDLTTFI
jgi:hypothetical protein